MSNSQSNFDPEDFAFKCFIVVGFLLSIVVATAAAALSIGAMWKLYCWM